MNFNSSYNIKKFNKETYVFTSSNGITWTSIDTISK